MDENTINEYGWIVVALSVVAIAIAFAPNFSGMLIDYAKQMISAHF